jgi:uncharacterized protein (TIGR00297 family)
MPQANDLIVGNWVSALVVSMVFALLARGLRGVTNSGAVAGTVICFVFYAGAGPGAFGVLVALFGVTWLATRVGYRKKQSLGTAENRDGRRASQVIANLGAAAICVVLYRIGGAHPFWLIGFTAALAEAAADTVSSEIGQSRADTARLITTWKAVPAGTDGGISLWGTLAGVSAAIAIDLVAASAGLVNWRQMGIPIAAGVAGTITDSLLGAALERRGWLNNDAVNFLSTCSAVGFAYLVA